MLLPFPVLPGTNLGGLVDKGSAAGKNDWRRLSIFSFKFEVK
jgi:hypothetical protein